MTNEEQDIIQAVIGLLRQGQYQAARENLEGLIRGLPVSQPSGDLNQIELVFDPHKQKELPEYEICNGVVYIKSDDWSVTKIGKQLMDEVHEIVRYAVQMGWIRKT